MKNLLYILVLCLISIQPIRAHAQDDNETYDPFFDYDEQDGAASEEADTNFFKNGRFLTMGLLIGQRSFTQGMSHLYENNVCVGGYLSYFFDLRFALQFGFTSGSHNMVIRSPVDTYTGGIKMNAFSMDLKYYMNTQNVTKGLAALNPYVLGGFTSISRETMVKNQSEFGKDTATAFDIGAGIEFPLMQKSMYFGVQGLYQIVNFRDEGSEIILANGTDKTGLYPNGDILTIMGIIGINF
ncbi:MAG: hypothetical protein A2Z20_03215 [Bdellovibrionales bacterium RBG_16_40_8]|nr:MAG: hypothetical protein A2Z20_03215 [Bdellovibrionales bacterium RBG_16_40_8]